MASAERGRVRRFHAGAALSAALSACSSAAPSRPPSSVSIDAPPAGSAAPAATLPSGWSAPVLDKEGPAFPAVGTAVAGRFRGGALSLFTFGGGTARQRPCPLLSPPEGSCSLLSVAKASVPPSSWYRPVSGDLAWGKPQPSVDYVAFFPGRKAAYGLHARGLDRVDEAGKATPLLGGDLNPDAVAVDTAKGVVLLDTSGSDLSARFASVEPGDEARPDDLTIAGFYMLADGMTTNMSRGILKEGAEAVALRKIAAVPLLDARGELTAGWAVILQQIVPPPYGFKPGKLRRTGKLGRVRSKHDCGGSSSRPLSDRSVEKRVHVIRFDGVKRLSDDVVAQPEGLAPLAAQPLPGGKIAIDGVVYDANGKATKEAPPAAPAASAEAKGAFASLTVPAPEDFVALAYSAQAHDGVAVVKVGIDRFAFRALSATGEPSGPAFFPKLPAGSDVTGVVRARDGWLAAVNERSLCYVDGPGEGRCLELPALPLQTPTSRDGVTVEFLADGKEGSDKRRALSVRLADGAIVDDRETSEKPADAAKLDAAKLAPTDEAERARLQAACTTQVELPGGATMFGCVEATDPVAPRWKAFLRVFR